MITSIIVRVPYYSSSVRAGQRRSGGRSVSECIYIYNTHMYTYTHTHVYVYIGISNNACIRFKHLLVATVARCNIPSKPGSKHSTWRVS